MMILSARHILLGFYCFALVTQTGISRGQAQEAVQTSAPLVITRVTPQGEDVSSTRQIVIEFNRSVVAISNMERTAEEIGVTVSPAVNCNWRWINVQTLACNLDGKDALSPATTYTIDIAPKITALDGAKLEEPYHHQFITERPDVRYMDFGNWSGAAHPLMRVVFNQPVSKSSVEKALFITDAGAENKYSRHYKLVASPDENEQEMPYVLTMPHEGKWVLLGGGTRKSDDQPTTIKGDQARRVWVFEPAQDLPENTEVRLMLGKGLVSALGPETSAGEREIERFSTYPKPEFLGVRCLDMNGDQVILPSGKATTKCDPLGSAALVFSSPVGRAMVRDQVVFDPPLNGNLKDYNPWGEDSYDYARTDRPYKKDEPYMVWLPVGLKAAQDYTLTMPQLKNGWWDKIVQFFTGVPASPFQDSFGRPIAVTGAMNFQTDHRKPNYELTYNDALLEDGVDSEVPLYVNNIESFRLSGQILKSSGYQGGVETNTTVPKVDDVQFAVPVGVRDMLKGKSGVLFGHIDTTPPIPNKYEGAGRLFAQVSPYQLTFKFGHYQSLVWVSDLATGQPVAGVSTKIYVGNFTDLGTRDVLANATTDANGIAILPGSSQIDPAFEYRSSYNDADPRLFVEAAKDDKMALLPLTYKYEVSTYAVSDDVYAENEMRYGHMKAWGTTAQGIYHTGDKIQYKIFVRDQDNKRFVAPPDATYTLEITDPMDNVVDTQDVSLSSFGTYSGEYAVPETAPVGWYHFNLTATFNDAKVTTRTLYPLRVLVSDFTPAPFHVTTTVKGTHFKVGDSMGMDALATLHAGGPYNDAALRVTATLESRPFESKNPLAQGFTFDSFVDGVSSVQLYQKNGQLSEKGTWEDTLVLPAQKLVYGTIEVESAVRDERGKSVAGIAQASFSGVDRLVGIKVPQWIYEKNKPMDIPLLVVDDKGNPAAGTTVNAVLEREHVVTAKVKGAGNAYLSDTTTTWEKEGECSFISALEAHSCTFTPQSNGTYRVTATIEDTQKVAHSSRRFMWVTGNDYVQWNDRDGDYLLVMIPEKPDYKLGDTAKFLIKNPYPGAKALVTIERFGVMDSFVTTLEGSMPIIEIPVKSDYVPGFYVSVTVLSPRVAAPPPEKGQIDMGKPALKIGYVKVPVIDTDKKIEITVGADKDVYRPRDTVKVKLKVASQSKAQEPTELAVAVLDESVFDLLAEGRNTFDPYNGFYSFDDLDMRNYNLLSALVGRQKFEKKGANPGGDGGADTGMRDQFKFVSYWNPSITPDKNGEADIEFTAPDNLTGWRVLAFAVTQADRMGLGEGTFKVNRSTEVRPVMPNQVHEGDQFKAGFSVMNRTESARTLRVEITAEGAVKGGDFKPVAQNITLAPYKRQSVFVDVDAALLPIDRTLPDGEITFKVTAADEQDSDGMIYKLPILKSRVIEVGANYATTTDKTISEAIVYPEDIYSDAGDVSVTLAPSVIGNLDGAFDYIRDYPFLCWEQRLTKGVMAAHFKNLKPWMLDKTTWNGSDTLPQAALDSASSFQAPNGGMVYFEASDDRVDPYLSAYTALAFTWLKESGYNVPEDVEEKLQGYLENLLRSDIAPDYYGVGMTSSVRAVALHALAKAGKVTHGDIVRYAPHMNEMSLFGKANFLEAALRTQNSEKESKEAATKIFASSTETGGKFVFSETYDDGYERILASPIRDNCAIMEAFADYAATPEGNTLIGDKPFKLVRYITQSRGSRDHWENTQENVFCLNALTAYARIYESVKPDMTVKAILGTHDMGQVDFHDVRDKPQTLSKPITESDIGQSTTMNLNKEGEGRLYVQTLLRYAPKKVQGDVNAGFDIHKEVSIKKDGVWTILKDPLHVKRGDVLRMDIFLSIPSARNFVVINDPLPGGLETVNSDLATASHVDAKEGEFDRAGGSLWFKYDDWSEYNATFWNFYHRELRHDSARFYADYLPAGNYHVSYTAQAIADGTFDMPPVKAEEMYDADVYGIGKAGKLHVEAAQ